MTTKTDALKSPLAPNLSAFPGVAHEEGRCVPLAARWAFGSARSTFWAHCGGGPRADNTRPYMHNANHSNESWNIQSVIWGFSHVMPNIWMTECFQFSPGWRPIDADIHSRRPAVLWDKHLRGTARLGPWECVSFIHSSVVMFVGGSACVTSRSVGARDQACTKCSQARGERQWSQYTAVMAVTEA